MNTTALFITVIALVIVIVAIAFFVLRNRSRRLQERFGPEYKRTVAETGGRWKAESALEHRAKRVAQLNIRHLTPVERTRFQDAWREVQGHFIDNPNETLVEADRLIGSVMSTEGYPVAEFEQRAADISVDHPVVVENYRGGHQIALRHARGQASTEDLRQAMIHYRSLFEDLLGQPEYTQTGRPL